LTGRNKLLFDLGLRGQLFPQQEQQNAFCRGDARLQSKSFVRWNQSLKRMPQLNPAFLILSATIWNGLYDQKRSSWSFTGLHQRCQDVVRELPSAISV
jgi:hypothetical protein